MMERNLTISLEPDWRAGLRATAQLAKAARVRQFEG